MNSTNTFFAFSVVVKKSHIDNLHHVNNIQYVKWVQDVAGKHWKTLSTKEIDEKFAWVVLSHEIQYLKSAYLYDKLTIKTYIGDSYGVKSERFVEIKRGDEIIVKAKTIWCLVSKIEMKPIRISNEILAVLQKSKS